MKFILVILLASFLPQIALAQSSTLSCFQKNRDANEVARDHKDLGIELRVVVRNARSSVVDYELRQVVNDREKILGQGKVPVVIPPKKGAGVCWDKFEVKFVVKGLPETELAYACFNQADNAHFKSLDLWRVIDSSTGELRIIQFVCH